MAHRREGSGDAITSRAAPMKIRTGWTRQRTARTVAAEGQDDLQCRLRLNRPVDRPISGRGFGRGFVRPLSFRVSAVSENPRKSGQ